MELSKLDIAKRKKITDKTPRISENGEVRVKYTFRLSPVILEQFEKEIYRKKMKGEKITKAQALEQAIKCWLNQKKEDKN